MGIPILIPNGDFVHCIPLYPTILEDGNRAMTRLVFPRGTCIGFHIICPGNECAGKGAWHRSSKHLALKALSLHLFLLDELYTF